ncbi:MAG: VOC family protein [Candidatus Acidiferrales bacterium]
MADKVKSTPKGYRSITPYLIIQGAGRAIEYYKKVFNAKEVLRMASPDGQKVMHAELKIGNSMVMLADEAPEMGARSPQAIGGTPVHLLLYVRNVDRVFKRAVKAGAKAVEEPNDKFYGDRSGRITDPFGHEWSLSTHKEDLSGEEIDRRAQAMYSGQKP